MSTRQISRRCFIGLLCGSVAGLTVPSISIAGDFRYRRESRDDWPRNLVRAVQRKLTDLGYDPGPVDGMYGPMTSSGIRRFQREKEMTVDGRISDELLRKLGLE